MAEPAGLGLDFLTQIVNVHWASGLAVEFGKQAEDAPKPPGPSATSTTQQLKRNRRRIG